ncbi:putative fatty acid elongation protein 3 [Halotydeus destructor]|nr:putative fatty acid elongation protein 3 [Halotydeus destructor]
MNGQFRQPADLYVEHAFVFPFETKFNATKWHYSKVLDGVHSWIYYVLLAYLVVVFSLKTIMANRKPFELKGPLILWNTSLALFSLFGSIRTVAELRGVWLHEGFDGTLCHDGLRFGVTGLWTFLFCMSKMPEMVDTLFIVLRKRPLIFLHWYHHFETCFYSIWSYSAPMIAVSRWFVTMNFCVHTLMYTYYALRAAGIRLPKQLSMAITLSQTTQMFIGLYVTLRAYNLNCGNYLPAVLGGLFTYSIYALLFTNFFINAYFGKPVVKSKSA